jgi:hypothetical protein
VAKMNSAKPEEAINAYTETVRKRTQNTVKDMAKMLQKEIKSNISKSDGHDQNWLNRNNNPYGKGPHPKGKTRSPVPHKKPFVHKQSGTMSQHVKIFSGKRKDELEVGIDQDDVPYVGDVLFGTRNMIGRNFLSHSLLNMNKKFLKMIKKIGKVK